MATKINRDVHRRLRQPSTYAGLFTIATAVLTGGMGVLTDLALLPQIGAGLALIFTEEPDETSS